MSNKIVYLACPYSHPDRNVRVARFEAVNKVASDLMRQGLKIFSPISHTHPVAEAGELPLGWDYWHEYDLAFLSASSKLIVLMVDGWKESAGVRGEIEIAEALGIEIEYMEYSERHYSPEETEARASADHENRANHEPATNSPEAQPHGVMEKVDFSCRVCGIQCAIAPDPPDRAVCPEHCEDHNYVYSREDRGTFCEYCWQEAPTDYWVD